MIYENFFANLGISAASSLPQQKVTLEIYIVEAA